MKPLSQRAGSWFAAGALLFLFSFAAHGESFAVNAPETDKRIDFKVDLQPQDPFSNANKVGAPREFQRGEVIRLVIQGAPKKGFHTYPLVKQFDGQKVFSTTLSYGKKNVDLLPLWPPSETPAEPVDEGKDLVVLEQENPFTWTQDLYIKPDAKPGTEHLHFTLQLTVCDQNTCVPGDHEFDVPFTILDAPVAAAPADLEQRLQYAPPPPEKLNFKGKDYNVVSVLPAVKPPAPPRRGQDVSPTKPEIGATTTNPKAAYVAAPASELWDLLVFIRQGVLWGALSLLTPCVFPMIPITVSFFLKQSEKAPSSALAGSSVVRKVHSPVLLAAVYSSTIAVVLTVAGVLLIPIVQPFSQHWATNVVLGSLFIFFALSLFGMYDIVLPSGLGRLTAAGEGRGGLMGVVFMALTFTVISFACVAPFYGGFIALSASASSAGDWLKLVLGALAFSVTFALPFFVLALFPFLLKALPKSGSWLNTVKVVMGFLELAAAFKFLRAAELNFFVKTEFLTYDLVLGIYIALAVACGLYLLGVYRLPHDHGTHETLTVPRLLFSVAFLGLGLYLTPGLFKTNVDNRLQQQRPGGTVFAWLDAFLLPEGTNSGWRGDLMAGLREADANSKLVFLDFTAQTCTNCRLNEREVFPQPEIKELLHQYVLVRLYTDQVPQDIHSSTNGAANLKLLHETFGTGQLPLYAILRPKGEGEYEVMGTYDEGKISNVTGFAQFLQTPLQPPVADARADASGE